MRRLRTIRVLACVMMLSAACLARPAQAGETMGADFGLGTATVFSNLLYGPGKLFYACMGGTVGGMAWLFSGGDNDVARPIWEASLRGTYALTKEHLLGREEIQFVGRSEKHQRARQATGSPDGDYSEGF